MIDISKMKAHATEVANDTTVCGNQIEREWAKTVLSLLSELEAREADRRDQLTRLLTIIEKDSEWTSPRAVDWTRGVLMATLKIALAQRQEGEEK